MLDYSSYIVACSVTGTVTHIKLFSELLQISITAATRSMSRHSTTTDVMHSPSDQSPSPAELLARQPHGGTLPLHAVFVSPGGTTSETTASQERERDRERQKGSGDDVCGQAPLTSRRHRQHGFTKQRKQSLGGSITIRHPPHSA